MKLSSLPGILLLLTSLLGFHSRAQQQDVLRQIEQSDSIADHVKAIKMLESIDRSKLNRDQQFRWLQSYLPRTIHNQHFDKTFKASYEGINLAKKAKNDSLLAFFTKQLGNANYYSGRRKEAKKIYLEAAEIAGKHGYREVQANALSNAGAVLVDLREFPAAENALLTSIELYTQLKLENTGHGLLAHRLLATLYTDMKRFDKAEPLYLRIIDLAKKNKDTTLTSSSLVNYGKLLSLQGKAAKALSCIEEAVALQRKTHDKTSLTATLGFLSDELQKQGKYKEANACNREIIGLNNSIFQDNLKKGISEVEVKYKTKEIQQEKEVAEAKTREASLNLILETQQKERYSYLLLAVIFLSLVIFLLFYLRNQKRKSKQQELLQQERLEALIEGEEKERSRIAKDLHDGIVQEITALRLNLNQLEKLPPAELTEELKKLGENLDRTGKEVREISYQMMPVTLRELGLIPALRDLMQKAFRTQGIVVEMDEHGLEERLPEKIEITLYRIIQELVNNVIKHSQATHVNLSLHHRNDFIHLLFEDNGSGFDTLTAKKGIGMDSLSDRLAFVNGEIQFESGENQGTTAIIRIPFKREHP